MAEPGYDPTIFKGRSQIEVVLDILGKARGSAVQYNRVASNTEYIKNIADAQGYDKKQLSVVQSGCVNGDAVRWTGSLLVPAIADSAINRNACGFIKNISGGLGDLYTSGIVDGFTGLTPGAMYYLSTTSAGAITTVKPEEGFAVQVGVAYSETELIIDIDFVQVATWVNYAQLVGINQVGCSNGQIVRWNGTALVPARANSTPNLSGLVGMIQNVNGSTGDVVTKGPVAKTGLVAGSIYFLSGDTAGAITTTSTGIYLPVGVAYSTTQLWLNIQSFY